MENDRITCWNTLMESRTETINVFYTEKIHGNKFSFTKILSYTISGKKANPIMGFFLLTFVSIITITGFSSISMNFNPENIFEC